MKNSHLPTRFLLCFFLSIALKGLPGRAQSPFLITENAAATGPFSEMNWPPTPTAAAKNVILVTIDGLRWEEIFGGADSLLMFADETANGDSIQLISDFWASTAAERRQKLMPFFWKTIATYGQLHGNRWLGSRCEVASPNCISFPGYVEMLCGHSTSGILTNHPERQANPTILEFLNRRPGFQGRVAAFASWDMFHQILRADHCGFPVNAGPGAAVDEKMACCRPVPVRKTSHQPPWPGVREDAATFQSAIDFLNETKPRALFLSFIGTDMAAHDGNYGRYLNYAAQADSFLSRLWQFLQNDPFYRGTTALLVTTDHGRGSSLNGSWKTHGWWIKGSRQTWMAFLGPQIPALGEADFPTTGGQILFQKDIAPTIAALLGLPFQPDSRRPGKPVACLFGNPSTPVVWQEIVARLRQ